MGEHAAKVTDVMILPDGNSGNVVLAVGFDRRVQVDGREFGFVVRAGDVRALHDQLGAVLAKSRIISLPSHR